MHDGAIDVRKDDGRHVCSHCLMLALPMAAWPGLFMPPRGVSHHAPRVPTPRRTPAPGAVARHTRMTLSCVFEKQLHGESRSSSSSRTMAGLLGMRALLPSALLLQRGASRSLPASLSMVCLGSAR
jgi:hypothetical protein